MRRRRPDPRESMIFLCVNCKALLEPGNVYCINCGVPIAESVYEEQTVIKPRPVQKERKSYLPLAILLGCAVIVGILVNAAANINNPKESLIASPKTPSLANQIPNTNYESSKSEVSNRDTPEPEPTAQTSRQQPDREKRNEEFTVQSSSPEEYPKEKITPKCSDYPLYQDGVPLRAVCNSGTPSYWQYDRWATCLMQKGVLEWCLRPSPPANKPINAAVRRPPANSPYFNAPFANAANRP